MAIETTNAEPTTDGMAGRPAYAFDVPDVFLAGGDVAGSDATVFDVRDFGAVADAGIDNTPARSTASSPAACPAPTSRTPTSS